VGCLVRKIQDLMQIEFSSCNVVNCSRLCNKVAGCLATYGACLLASGSDVYWCQAPEFVTELISGDLPDVMPNAVVFDT